MPFKISYEIEYADETTGHGSHGNFRTHAEAVEAKNEMRDRVYTVEELGHLPIYYNFSIEEV